MLVAGLAHALHLAVLPLGDERSVDGEDVAQQHPKLLDALVDVNHVVCHVAQVLLQALIDAVLVEASCDRVDNRDERVCCALKVQHLARQLVDAPGDLRVTVEHLAFDLVDVVLEARDDRRVSVDHGVEDGVEHRLGAEREQLGSAFETAAHNRQVGAFGMSQSDDEVGADEHVQFAELDFFFVIEIACGPQHQKQRAVVPLDLGSLMRVDRIFDGQLMQIELVSQRFELGIVGAIQPDPRHRSCVALEVGVRLSEGSGARDPASVDVDRIVDDARTSLRGGQVGTELRVVRNGSFTPGCDRLKRPADAECHAPTVALAS